MRIVPFFITKRYAGQSDRAAFAEVLLEQLADLLDEPMPPFLSEANRVPHLWKRIADAARLCRDRGERLILLVDGLDEDTGVTAGPSGYSIAALLPSRLPDGMRVVVAGRPDPPPPPDLPDDHPLRDPGVVRPLTVSGHASVVRQDANRELDRLRTGTPVEQDLLGLITASGGGLSGADLADLTALEPQDIEDHLHSVVGRTFTRQVSRWRHGAEAEVYVLCHEELVRTAVRYIGTARLAAYRDRLHAWADRFRSRNWPPDTPDYLLRGYHRMLCTSGNVTEAVRCALDVGRHDRMLDLTGGDMAALAEIHDALDLAAARPEPDLLTVARLARHRDDITSRNAHIPEGLPAVWVLLGQPARAEAMARGIAAGHRRDHALAGIIAALAETGATDDAVTLVNELTTPTEQATALATVALWKARRGDFADDLLQAATAEAAKGTEGPRDTALSAVVDALVAAGRMIEAKETALTIDNVLWSGPAFARIVEGWIAAGDLDAAETLARQCPSTTGIVRSLCQVARARFDMGRRDHAMKTIDEAMDLARQIADTDFPGTAYHTVTRTLAQLGQATRAAVLTSELVDPEHRAVALAGVGAEATLAGDEVQARRMFRMALHLARSGTGIDPDGVVADVASHLIRAGRHDQADQVTADLYQRQRDRTLSAIATDLASRGRFAEAAEVTQRITDLRRAARTLAAVAATAARSGAEAFGTATDLAVRSALVSRELIDGEERVFSAAATRAATQVILTGHARAGRYEEAISCARFCDSPPVRGYQLARAAMAAAAAGRFDTAERIADSIDPRPGSSDRGWALAEISLAAARSGDPERGSALLARAAAESEKHPPEPELSGRMHAAVAVAADLLGRPELARRHLATLMTGPSSNLPDAARAAATMDREELALQIATTAGAFRERALQAIVESLNARGDLARAEAVAVQSDQGWPALYRVRGHAANGDHARALGLARRIDHAGHRAEALAAVAESRLGSPDVMPLLEEAEAAANQEVSYPARHAALSAVVQALAEAGHHTRAAALLETVHDRELRQTVLTTRLRGLDPSEQRRIVASAFRDDYATVPLEALAHVDPDSLLALAGEFR